MPKTRMRSGGSCSGSSTPRNRPGTSVDQKYSCPVCLEYILPPVLQCANGHLICNVCHGKVRSCPECREPYVGKKIRNLVVESIVRESVFECKNQEAGCGVRLKYDHLKDHELDCKFSALNYCESLGLCCDRKVLESGILEHMKNVHNIKGVDSSVSVPGFSLIVDLDQTVAKADLEKWQSFVGLPSYFKFDEKVFFLKTQVNTKERFISWMVCVSGSQGSCAKYRAKIQYFPTESMKHSVDWQGGVCCLDRKFEDELTLCIPFKTILMVQGLEPRYRRPLLCHLRTRLTISIPNAPINDTLFWSPAISYAVAPVRPVAPIASNSINHTGSTSSDNHLYAPYEYLGGIIPSSSDSSDSDADDNNSSIYGVLSEYVTSNDRLSEANNAQHHHLPWSWDRSSTPTDRYAPYSRPPRR